MPTYDYTCKFCSKELEIFHSMTEAPRTQCPECGKAGLEKQISSGAGIIFKGTGFYETDYKTKTGSKDKDSKPENNKTTDKSSSAHSCKPSGCGCN